jgi:hypothetical protein
LRRRDLGEGRRGQWSIHLMESKRMAMQRYPMAQLDASETMAL